MTHRDREKKIREFLASPPFGRWNVTDREIELFDTALTHDSYANEETSRGGSSGSYERLEFLGDAVMELIVCEHIFSDTDLSEGAMTDMKKNIVCNDNIAARVRDAMRMDDVILVGEGHKDKRTGRNMIEDCMRADAFEAVLGAVYILYGMDEAKRIVYEIFID
ncbi:MAG: hypothetical protein FWD81_03950 [Methanomassiliicoccaceae archaeon]|nr:hypothetical protein [Methanomassiliicoccaceae archaeon]